MAAGAGQVSAQRAPVAFGKSGIQLSSLEDAIRFANGLIEGGLAPKGMAKAGAVVAVIQAGAEIGMPPMWALSNITFTNGRLGLMGDACAALIRNAGVLEDRTDLKVEYSGAEMTPEWTCTVTALRKGAPPIERSFSLGKAIRAGLCKLVNDKERGWVIHTYKRSDGGGWGLWDAPWTRYPDRLLYYRALGFLARDGFSDVLMGLHVTEELRDYPRSAERDVTPGAERAPAAPDPLLQLPETSTAEVLPAEDAPGRELEAEPVRTGPVSEPVQGRRNAAHDGVPPCKHPDGFSPTTDNPAERVCIHCGEVG